MKDRQKEKKRLRPEGAAAEGKRGKRKLPGWGIALLAAAALVCLGFTWFRRGDLILSSVYRIESTSEITFGENGQTLVIDNGKKTLLVLDAEGNLITRYDGGSSDAPFYYACYAVQTADGSIYVADIEYGERGNLLDRERIVRLRGKTSEVLFEVDYTDKAQADTPLQYGRILELQAWDGAVYFLLDTGRAIQLKRIASDGTITDLAAVSADFVKSDASYDAATGKLVTVSRKGEMQVYDLWASGTAPIEVDGGSMPYDVAARSGEVYYTELQERAVRHFSLSSPSETEIFCALEEFPFKLDVSPDGRDVLTTDQVGFYRLTGDGQHACVSTDYVDEAHISYLGRVVLTWALLVLGAFCALILLVKAVIAIAGAAMRSENALRVVLIVAASLAVSFVLDYSLLNQFMEVNTTSTEKEVALFSELLLSEVDEDALLTLDSTGDHGTEAFAALKEPLDAHTWGSYESEDYFYYILYRSIDGNVVMVMDFEDTMPCARPMYIDDPEDNIYAEVMHTGESIQISEVSSYGAWSFRLSPICGADGSIIGELEVGQSLDRMQSLQRKMARELIISALVSTVVMAMLLLELTFLLAHIQRRRSGGELDSTQTVPLRTVMFLIYLADSMQDAFIAILCSQLYRGGFPFPEGVAIALPMSAQLLMMALFSFFAGRLVEKFGSRMVMTAGMLINLAGFLICMILGNYPGLLIGKMLIGAGMGTVYVSCNTVAATGGSSDLIADANAAISAGTLAGLTIGAGLSSILLSMGSWRLIYLVGGVIAAIGLLLALSAGDVRLTRSAQEDSGDKMISAFKFFTSRRVMGFFLLVLVPFMMALSYREYFFPLFSAEHGIDEVRIGQIYLLCGMLTLYIGPSLSSWMIRRLGSFWSIVAASAAMVLNMLLFVLFPSLATVILGVVFLSLIISFAYTVQYTYYELTPETMLYGEGRAVGVYSVFESLGQTVGPVAYGALLSLGYRQGIRVFCIEMSLFLGIFVILMWGVRKPYRD